MPVETVSVFLDFFEVCLFAFSVYTVLLIGQRAVVSEATVSMTLLVSPGRAQECREGATCFRWQIKASRRSASRSLR